jgi:hypothetical protein
LWAEALLRRALYLLAQRTGQSQMFYKVGARVFQKSAFGWMYVSADCALAVRYPWLLAGS